MRKVYKLPAYDALWGQRYWGSKMPHAIMSPTAEEEEEDDGEEEGTGSKRDEPQGFTTVGGKARG